MNGGDLRFHISRKTFTEEAVRFWIAELGCALRYIHQQGIVHRDVKPDNVLLDSEGHVHLADFVSHVSPTLVGRFTNHDRTLRPTSHQTDLSTASRVPWHILLLKCMMVQATWMRRTGGH